MKRSLLLLALAVFAVGASSIAQDGERTGDGEHRVVYSINPVTGEYLFAGDIDPLLFNPAETSSQEISVPFGNAIQMNRIAELPVATHMLTTSKGFDMDQDGQREFITRAIDSTPGWDGGLFHFYECTGDNSFALVHVIEITNWPAPFNSVQFQS